MFSKPTVSFSLSRPQHKKKMDRDYEQHEMNLEDENRKIITTKTTTVTPYDVSSGAIPPPGTQEEWTTTKRKVNHKTKQVETRVQRQIIMEDGKVIADSGPQVTTKTTEDQKSDESEDTKHRRLGDSEVPEKYRGDLGNQVVSEKTITHNVSREAKEENYQYHDESLRQLEGKDIHRKAVKAPHELIKIDNNLPEVPRGKMVHFSSKGRKIQDSDQVQEVSRLNKDGMLNTETIQTHQHEEHEDDEVPEEEEGEAHRNLEPSQHRQIEYNRDYDDHRSSRTNSSMSVSRNNEHRGRSHKWHGDDRSGEDSDVIETSEVYKLSDRLRSMKTSKAGGRKTRKTKKDDVSTQASLSDSDNDSYKHGRKEVHEHIEARKSPFVSPDHKCVDPSHNRYYFGTDPANNNNNENGFISANVKTSRFAMENNRVVEDKSFDEDFERTFKDKQQQASAHRDYDRFVQHTRDHTKAIPKLGAPGASTEYIHRPVLVEHSSTLFHDDKPSRSRSFYDHQQTEYERSKSHRSYGHEPASSYSTLPAKPSSYASPYRARSPSPVKASGTWSRPYSTDPHAPASEYRYNTATSSFNARSNSRTDFPDFAPLSSPLEIKSLTENALKSRQHVSTYH